jgi:hypothetical protein
MSILAASPRIYESREATATTEGDVTLSCDPDTAYRTATDYERWSRIFPDVRQVIVTNRRGDEADVTFVHADGNRDHLHFRNRPATRTVWFEQLGGRADVHAEIAFRAGERPGITHVHSRLYADVHGFAAALVSDDEIRSQRQHQVRQDLMCLQAFFRTRS